MLIYLGIEAAEPLDNGIRIVNKISSIKDNLYLLKVKPKKSNTIQTNIELN